MIGDATAAQPQGLMHISMRVSYIHKVQKVRLMTIQTSSQRNFLTGRYQPQHATGQANNYSMLSCAGTYNDMYVLKTEVETSY